MEMSSNKNKTIRFFLSCFLLVSSLNAFSQEESAPLNEKAAMKIDSLYREDQFYFSITYNTLIDKPAGLSQRKFSSGFSGGFLRDMPINRKRTIAVASGIGFTYNNYNQNMAISGTAETPLYTLISSDTKYSKNKFTTLSFDVPVEFRWRTSTYESHKFWRIYTGIKFSYVLYDKSVFNSSMGKVSINGNKDFNKLQYGAYISSGYNTFNLYAYYGLNSLFKSAKINDEAINMKAFNLGIIFYIL